MPRDCLRSRGRLDNAIADAVAAFGSAHEISTQRHADNLQERLAADTAEYRRLALIAIQSFNAIKTGHIGVSGATGGLLSHALEELLSVTDRPPQNLTTL